MTSEPGAGANGRTRPDPPPTPVRALLRAFLIAAILGFLLTLVYVALR